MKFLIDTCGWIEWLTNGKLVRHFEPYLKKLQFIITPTIIQYELYKWLCREQSEETALEIITVIEQTHVINLDTKIALLAASVSAQHNLAMADAIIYATAQYYNCKLITCDNHFINFANVEYFKK